MFFDTNIIINILSDTPDESVLEKSSKYIDSGTAYISEVALMELLSWSSLTDSEVKAMLASVLKIFKVKRHTRKISLKSSEIRRVSKKVKLPDAIIAATAIYYDRELFTNNLEDFKNIDKLKIAQV